MDETLYKSLVGSLMYITTTRPDIQFVVSYISRFVSKPTEVHFAAAKRVLRYLQGTLDYGIWYKRGGDGRMENIVALSSTEAEYVAAACACQLQRVGTKEKIVDIFTQPLRREVFVKLRERLGVC
nr:retrotransposon-related protein [Tanacetum cinerariifolium]